MARIIVDPSKVQAKLLLDVVSAIQDVRALNKRVCDIMDFTRLGPNFLPLGEALGCSEGEAEALYGRMRTIEIVMNGGDFQNLSDMDQG